MGRGSEVLGLAMNTWGLGFQAQGTSGLQSRDFIRVGTWNAPCRCTHSCQMCKLKCKPGLRCPALRTVLVHLKLSMSPPTRRQHKSPPETIIRTDPQTRC